MKKVILEGLNIKHYSHTDLDGVFPIILTKKILSLNPKAFLKGTQKYFNIEPNELYNEIEKSIVEIKNGECDLVIITDLTFNQKEYSLIHNFGLDDHFLIFDHHVSDLFPKYTSEFLTDNITIKTHDIDQDGNKFQLCGTRLYYDYLIRCGYIDPSDLHLASFEQFVELVRLYDTYEFNEKMNANNPMAKEAPRLNSLYHLLGIDLFTQYLTDFGLGDYSSVFIGTMKYPYIEALLANAENEEKKYIDKRVKAAEIRDMVIDYTTYSIAVTFAEKNQSEIGRILYENGADIAVMIGANAFSLRTKKGSGINLCKIAKSMYGGGHVESAGFPMTNKIVSSIFDTIKEGMLKAL